MNAIDIVILAIIAFALYRGAREGIIIQVFSLVGIGLGIWFGTRMGSEIAAMVGISGGQSAIWGFVIILTLSIITITIAARLLRKVVKFAGFGLLDIILGAVLSAVKYMFIVSVLLTAFDTMNQTLKIVEHKHIEKSALYRPVANLRDQWLTPAWEWTQEQLGGEIKEMEKSVKSVEKEVEKSLKKIK